MINTQQLFPYGTSKLLRRWLQVVLGIVFLSFAVFLTMSCLRYHSADPSLNTASISVPKNLFGYWGAVFADMFLQGLGLGSIVFVSGLIIKGFNSLRNFYPKSRFRSSASFVFILIFACFYASLWPRSVASWPLACGMGGALGDILAVFILKFVGLSSLKLAWILFFPTIFILFTAVWWGLGLRLADILVTSESWVYKKTTPKNVRAKPLQAFSSDDSLLDTYYPPEEKESSEHEEPRSKDDFGFPVWSSTGEFRLPSIELLEKERSSSSPKRPKADVIGEQAAQLMNVLEEFGVQGNITNVLPGPIVTLYELKPAPGIKTSRVVGLADDISRSMSAISTRIAVIPGKNAIGIELPNPIREVVSLRDLFQSAIYQESSAALPLVLGKDISGQPIVSDLTRMPHLLVAGTTGSGKSVSINTMILSLLYRASPEECRFIMIDPKMLELSVYNGIPHLLTPVVTDPKKAIVALKWTVKEMENRYRLMTKLGARNIEGYNSRLKEAKSSGELLIKRIQTGFDPDSGKPIFENQQLAGDLLPYIVVIVDEMADLMMVAGKDIETAVQRLAQMARAAGIHLIMATQRPSVDVITGTIKANFPTRISFQVTSKIDSRTILGEQGAEQLLGHGDMLFMQGGGRLMRVHGAYCRDIDVEKVAQFLGAQSEPSYVEGITTDTEEEINEILNDTGSDQLYRQAVELVMREGKASTSFIQRHLQIGYNRAARIIEMMEKQGVVSQANHSGKREVLGER